MKYTDTNHTELILRIIDRTVTSLRSTPRSGPLRGAAINAAIHARSVVWNDSSYGRSARIIVLHAANSAIRAYRASVA